jgi:DUF971 family protein
MRIYSPSAEVQGHGPGQEILQTGKREVDVVELEPIGNYAVKPVFSDGHQSGIFSWDYLYRLGAEQSRLWDDYQRRLQAAGMDRDAPMPKPAATAARATDVAIRAKALTAPPRAAKSPALRHCCFSSIKARNKAAMPRVSPGLSGSIPRFAL